MSVIQNIREKYAKWAVVAIALALLGFILTDYFQAKSRSGGGPTTIGVINGKKIDFRDFQARLDAAETQARANAEQMGQEYDEAQRHNTNEALWNRDVEKVIMSAEFEKAGIDVGGKELTDFLYQNPPQDLRQRFSDQMGNFNAAELQNMINQIRRGSNQVEKDQLNLYLADLEYGRKLEKYNAILANSVYYPKWYIEKQNAEAAQMAKVSYVSYPYTNIADSTITVTDKEIEDYVSKHKETYKQEESRSIAFVMFDAAATAQDSAQLRTQLDSLKPKFANDTLPSRFLNGNGSATPYADQYQSKTELQSQTTAADSIIDIAKGSVYGPYLDQHTYVLAKKVDEKRLADSVYCRHILIRSGANGLPDSIAEKRIDSVINVINRGASFVNVMKQVSMDTVANTQDSLGIMRFSIKDITNVQGFDQDFAKFILYDGKKGERKKVKTQFGYHYIDIVDQKNIQPYYKFAFFSKNIIASKETERKASEEASKFSNEIKDLASFNAAIEKSGGRYKKVEASNIKPTDISIPEIDRMFFSVIGFGKVISCRSLIKEIYQADKGEVLSQEKIGDPRIGNKQVVAVVTDILKKGTMPARVARTGTSQAPGVERILKDKKKAGQIKKMVGTITTLEAAAAIFKDSIITIDSVRFSGARGLVDAKVLGAIFNSANKGRIVPEPIAGNNAVYVLRVDDVTTTQVMNAGIESQQEQLRGRAKQMQTFYSSPISVLRKTAEIRDNRENFY